jgi:hypothetical protein
MAAPALKIGMDMIDQRGRAQQVYNHGGGRGGVASMLLRNGMNTDPLRSWIGSDGMSYYTTRDPRSGKLVNVHNYDTPALLLKDEWKYMESGVIGPVLPRLQVWQILSSRIPGMSLPNGMATTIIEEQTETDAGFATVSMNGLARSDRDRPEYDIRGFPIPIIHGEFGVDLRHLLQTRQQGRPFDVSMGRMVTRRIIEKVENMAIGEATTFKYGGHRIYGLTNHPNRYTKVLTLPTAPGWTPRVFVDEVIEMIDTLNTDLFTGPYGMFFSPAWQKFMGQDYSDVYPGVTLASRLAAPAPAGVGLSFMNKLEYGLSDYQVIIFQLTDDVVRTINGMDLRTFQWEEKGGWEILFKIACIYLTQLRTRENDDLGVIHGVAA